MIEYYIPNIIAIKAEMVVHMRLRITQKELDELTFEQMQNLCELWIPHVYDVAVANLCINAEEEVYEKLTFVVGGIQLVRHHSMILFDFKYMPDDKDKESDDIEVVDSAEPEELDSTQPEVEEDFSLPEDFMEEDFVFEFQRPTSFSKQDCLPLLDIGQMIDILDRKGFGQGDFYLTATIGDYTCDIGKHDSAGGNYDPNNVESDLVQVLWESVKALL